MTAVIDAPSALSVGPDGEVEWAKDPDSLQRPASTMKTLTLYVARKWVDDDALTEQVTVTTADMTSGTLAGLQAGDVVTWNDLFHGLMLPSGNDAARCIGRVIGDRILAAEGATGSGLTRFITEMGNVAAGDFGWTDPVPTFGSTAGFPDTTSRMTARQLCELMRHLDATDRTAIQIAAARSWQIVVTGPNARIYTVHHSVSTDGFPELIAAKSGYLGQSYGAVANTSVLWADPYGGRHVTTVLGSWPPEQRYVDLRAVMDDVIAALPPPEPGGLQLRLTDGRLVTLMRSNGTPATA